MSANVAVESLASTQVLQVADTLKDPIRRRSTTGDADEIIDAFDSNVPAHATAAKARKLLDVASLKQVNLELSRRDDLELDEMRDELERLRQEALCNDPTIDPQTQRQIMLDAIKAKRQHRRLLREELKHLRHELRKLRPIVERELRTSLEAHASLAADIDARRTSSTLSPEEMNTVKRQREEVLQLRRSVGEQLKTNVGLEMEFDTQRNRSVAVRADRIRTIKRLQLLRTTNAVRTRDGERMVQQMRAELTNKNQLARNRYQQLLHLAQGVEKKQISSRRRHEVSCRACGEVYEKPAILWPCGHTVCQHCVLIMRDGRASMISDHQHFSRSESTHSSRPTSAPSLPSSSSSYFVCPLCQSSFDRMRSVTGDRSHPSYSRPTTANRIRMSARRYGSHHHHDAINASDGDDDDADGAGDSASVSASASLPNPLLDPPPSFAGRFLLTPNPLIQRHMDAYWSCASRFDTARSLLSSLSQSLDEVDQYLRIHAHDHAQSQPS